MRTGRVIALVFAPLALLASCRGSTLPTAVEDDEFWRLSERLSEPAGRFPLSDNYVSNERRFADRLRWLEPGGGVYVGVGPEQNFSYIARLRPAAAFIVDIRRENRALHFMYRALFDLSRDRADFLALLFSRPRPANLSADAELGEMFARLAGVPASADMRATTSVAIRQRLTIAHRWPVSPDDLQAIEVALSAFMRDGPQIQFWGERVPTGEAPGPSYRELMLAEDMTGQRRSFLATADAFAIVKDLQARNLVIPVIGDFGGVSALRGIGDYVRAHRANIRAFYASNVAVYLSERQTRAFCANLRTLPVAPGAWFIESDSMRTFAARLAACVPERATTDKVVIDGGFR